MKLTAEEKAQIQKARAAAAKHAAEAKKARNYLQSLSTDTAVKLVQQLERRNDWIVRRARCNCDDDGYGLCSTCKPVFDAWFFSREF